MTDALTQQTSSEQIRTREAAILGAPPRIPPMTEDEFTPEIREMIASLQRAVGLVPDGKVADYVATMLRHPALNRAHTDLALTLMRGTLGDRDRELAVLRTGWLCRAPYEWNAHVNVGKRIAGLTSEEIERVTVGAAAPEWGDDDRMILTAVEELFADAMISEKTWAALAGRLSYQQLLELPLLVGQYQGVAYLQNSIRATLMPGDIGLTAR